MERHLGAAVSAHRHQGEPLAGGAVGARDQPLGGAIESEAQDLIGEEGIARRDLVAARGMLGLDARQPAVPFFWTYHYGKRFDYLGHARAGDWDSCLTLGEPERYAFVTLYCRDGRVIAALGCERETAIALLAEAMREPLPADDARRIVEQADNGDAG